MNHITQFLQDLTKILGIIDPYQIHAMVEYLVAVRLREGRVFFLGVGGSAASCSHAVNDFRKIAHIECYTPTDNVSELTARANDEGWESTFVEWLRGCRLSSKDAIFVLSVGGGDLQRHISPNIVAAIDYANEVSANIFGIVGRDGGYTAGMADICIVIPTVNPQLVTALTESMHAVICHLLVTHPSLQQETPKWEGVRHAS